MTKQQMAALSITDCGYAVAMMSPEELALVRGGEIVRQERKALEFFEWCDGEFVLVEERRC